MVSGQALHLASLTVSRAHGIIYSNWELICQIRGIFYRSIYVKLSKISYFFCELFLNNLPSVLYFGFLWLFRKHDKSAFTTLKLDNSYRLPLGFRKANGIRYAVLPKHFWTKKENCTHCQARCESFCFSFSPHPSLPPCLWLSGSIWLSRRT